MSNREQGDQVRVRYTGAAAAAAATAAVVPPPQIARRVDNAIDIDNSVDIDRAVFVRREQLGALLLGSVEER